MTQHAVIVGAGLAGSLLACHLARAGWKVDVYEGRPDPRNAGFIGGRSINLALSTRGIDALNQVGLAERVLKDAVAMPGRMLHDKEGRQTFQPYSGKQNNFINSVSRGGLNITLLKAADDYDSVTLHFERSCTGIDLKQGIATVCDLKNQTSTTPECDLLIGADGAFSKVRESMATQAGFSHSISYIDHGYKELTIPAAADGSHVLDPEALHIWPHGESMMIALANQDGSFTCTLFWPWNGPISFNAIKRSEDVQPLFEAHFKDVVPLMPDLVELYMKNPTSSLQTIRCGPWHFGDKVVLIGDSAHAIVPFFGQGMNAAFEDCTVLTRHLSASDSVAQAIAGFYAEQKPNAEAIADLALSNFIEMRDTVRSPIFNVKKKIERFLTQISRGRYKSLYEMVSFTTIPYAKVCQRARRRQRILLAALFTLTAVLIICGLLAIGSTF
ncbi:MAG: NAD(P)/FAD-dependent oxidoreductase [Phycisphaerales bacterium]|nr:NAD(P)/FAD-dependent oxidoreductase [Phycisphaerales bacterium]